MFADRSIHQHFPSRLQHLQYMKSRAFEHLFHLTSPYLLSYLPFRPAPHISRCIPKDQSQTWNTLTTGTIASRCRCGSIKSSNSWCNFKPLVKRRHNLVSQVTYRIVWRKSDRPVKGMSIVILAIIKVTFQRNSNNTCSRNNCRVQVAKWPDIIIPQENLLQAKDR